VPVKTTEYKVQGRVKRTSSGVRKGGERGQLGARRKNVKKTGWADRLRGEGQCFRIQSKLGKGSKRRRGVDKSIVFLFNRTTIESRSPGYLSLFVKGRHLKKQPTRRKSETGFHSRSKVEETHWSTALRSAKNKTVFENYKKRNQRWETYGEAATGGLQKEKKGSRHALPGKKVRGTNWKSRIVTQRKKKKT